MIMTKGVVHWHEGQFLQPQLFQMAQRQQWMDRSEDRRASLAFPYGVLESAISQDALEAKRVKFTKLRVVMKSGLMLELGRNMDLPDLDISRAFAASVEPFVVRLGVPVYQETRPNTIAAGTNEDRRVRQLYREVQTEVVDENTADNPQMVSVRMVNARLMLESDDTTDIDWLAVLRIKHQTGQRAGFPAEDKEFYPTCLTIMGSEYLRAKVADLVTDVGKCREEVVKQLAPGFNVDLLTPRKQTQIMRLQTLNRFTARLGMATVGSGVQTMELYLLLRELHGELAALSPDRDPFVQAPQYNHDKPSLWYDDLDRQIRKLLLGDLPNKFRRIDLKMVPPTNWHHGELGENDRSEPKAYYLGIKSTMDVDALRRIVQDESRFKLMPATLAAEEVRGVRMYYEPQPPLELPQEIDLRYFRVIRDDTMENNDGLRKWNRILAEKKLVVRWSQGVKVDLSDMGLYMVLP
jgi:type VI secretion system protein ImpJ